MSEVCVLDWPRFERGFASVLAAGIGLATGFAPGSAGGGEPGDPAAEPGLPGREIRHLFLPVPRAAMRELSTDRPDQTESPYTVDAGHFQVEAELVGATFDRDGGVTTREWGNSLNLKAGLLDRVDLQLVVDPYASERIEDRAAGTVVRRSGFGEIQTRLKINLWGNDDGVTALGIMPYVKWALPEGGPRNGETEGGVIVPLAVGLPEGWGMGLMTQIDFVAAGAGGHDAEFFNTVTFGHDIVGDLAGYVEFAARVAPESGDGWQGQIGLGFTYGLGVGTQLDFGCNFGVTGAAPDFNPFLGLTFRY